MALAGAGWGRGLIPACELEGRPDKPARLAFLVGVPCAFTRSDRSMVLRTVSGRWWAVVDDDCLPGQWENKAAALAAARKAERAADNAAATAMARNEAIAEAMAEELPPLPPQPDYTAVLKTPQMRHAARRMQMADTADHEDRVYGRDWTYEWGY